MQRFLEYLRYISVPLFSVFLYGVLFKGDRAESLHYTYTLQLFWGMTFQFFSFYCKFYPQNTFHILYLMNYLGTVSVAIWNIIEYPSEFHYCEP